MRRQSEFSLRFVKNSDGSEHMHQDVQLLFVLSGCVRVTVSDHTYTLEKEDVMVINSNDRHSWVQREASTLLLIHFNYSHLLGFIEERLMYFYCNSAVESGDTYTGLRNILNELISEYAVHAKHPTLLEYSRIYCLEDYLIRFFMPGTGGAGDHKGSGERTEVMFKYIYTNYNRHISLKEMADYMYMIPSSFSRFFRQKTGTTFVKYLNDLRLWYAMEDVRYSDKTMVQIASDHGFPSAASFSGNFCKIYGVPPMEYRKKYRLKKDEDHFLGNSYAPESGDGMLDMEAMLSYCQEVRVGALRYLKIEADVRNYKAHNNIWAQALCLGAAHELLNAQMQGQILKAKKELGIIYGRVEGVFSSKMDLRPEHAMHIVNYQTLDLIFDFLVSHQIHPFIYMENKYEKILKSPFRYVKHKNSEEIFCTIQECQSVLGDFVDHMVCRYGQDEVEQWIFEIWYNEADGNTLGIPGSFFDHFTKIYQTIRKYLKKARIGGCGFGPGGDHTEKFQNWILEWQKQPVHPDFVSASLFPYLPGSVQTQGKFQRTLLSSYYLDHFSLIEHILKGLGWGDIPLYTTEWNLTISQRSSFNDSCGKAALMLRQMCHLTNRVPFAAYMGLSDLPSVFYDSGKIFIGGDGLLTSTGLAKPAFWAMKLMHLMDDYVIDFCENYLITTDQNHKYSILIFNVKELKYDYYINEEDSLCPASMADIFSDTHSMEISIHLTPMEDGIYQLYEYGLSPECGSAFEAWQRLGNASRLSYDNMEYLKNICIPYQKNGQKKAVGGVLEFKEVLTAQEIRLITVRK